MGSRKKPKVGNRYFFTTHLIPCRKADAILAIRMADKILWEGDQGDGYIVIDDREAFGGDEREGGFSGRIAVALGKPAQAANAYLKGLFGALTPAFRGVVSLIFEQPYFNANSARLPAIKTKQVNVTDIHKGWLPEKCVVEAVSTIAGAGIYIAMDLSGSMRFGNLPTQIAALAAFVRGLKGKQNSLKVVAFNDNIGGRIERFDCSDQDYEDVALWIEAYTNAIGSTNWGAAVSEAAAFFDANDNMQRSVGEGLLLPNLSGVVGSLIGGGLASRQARRILIMTTDGVPNAGTSDIAAATVASIARVECFVFNIEETNITESLKVDNTPQDGVPVVSGTNPSALRVALQSNFRSWVDLNPAHLQRCLLIDKMRGGTATPSDIGDSFSVSADEYIAEGFGLSVRFSGADGNHKDRQEIDRHCDAATFRSRRTGKWEHKRVRDDFDISELPVLDSTVVKDWSKLRRPKRRELPNKLTVIYTDRSNGGSASVTKSNPVAVRAAGVVRKAPDVQYPYVSNPVLADRLCVRDVTAGAAALLAGDLPLAYLPPEFEQTTAVVLRGPPDTGIEDVAVRITEIRHAGGTSGEVWLKVVEHRFEPGARVERPEPMPVQPVSDRPQPAVVRMVEEAPYYLQVLQDGQRDVDASLTEEPGLGRVVAAAGSPGPRHLDATAIIDPGTGWQDEGVAAFSASTVTLDALGPAADAVSVRIAVDGSLTRVVANQLAKIGPEIVRVDSVSEVAGSLVLTIGRGCLDTVPVAHTAGATVLFFGQAEILDESFVAGEAVAVKLLTRTGSALLTIPAAPIDTVTFNSRAIRPYPPGRFQLNGSYVQGTVINAATLTWVHRDRTQQTTLVPEDHDDGTIGPEAGVTYRVTVDAFDEDDAPLGLVTSALVGSATSYVWDLNTPLPASSAYVRFRVTSLRDGYESWQSPALTAVPEVLAGILILLESAGPSAPEDCILTENSDNLVQE